MGQQNLFDYNQEALFKKHSKNLMNQVELWYINDKFAIETDYKEEKALHDYLLQDMYKTNNCELRKFLDKKLRGALGDENIDLVDLKSMQITYIRV